MIYLRVGLFAEGVTDYHFLLGLIDRMLLDIAAEVLAGDFDDARPIGIDAPKGLKDKRREERIAAAIEASYGECTLFVVHSDGAGDPEGARRALIDPGVALARERHPDLKVAACVPVRETEAWMITDAAAFGRIFKTSRVPDLPQDPEAEIDPKRVLAEALREMGANVHRGIVGYYAELGRELRPSELRRLAAFRRFEGELRAAVGSDGKTGR
jgi:hypothetical protein